MFGGEIHHALAVMQEYPVGKDKKAVRLLLDDQGKRGVEVFRFAHLTRLQLDIQSLCRGGRAGGHDYIHVGGDEFGNEGRKPFVSSFRPAKHDLDVAALLVAVLAQAFAERSNEIGLQSSRGVAHEADSRNLSPMLRARSE